jgi:hypothetical protein
VSPREFGAAFRRMRRAGIRWEVCPTAATGWRSPKPGSPPSLRLIDVRSATPISRTVTMALGVSVVQGGCGRHDAACRNGSQRPTRLRPRPDGHRGRYRNSGALDLGDFMNRRLNGVYLNEMQGNPFQPDVNFRGYTASPLLGTPEGISVYLDGVRQNQPFGDVVSWDLIPKDAISEMTLVPGSDPLFGLNTLGGALSVQTKNGVSNPGLEGALFCMAAAGERRLKRGMGRRQSHGLQLVSCRDWIPRIGMALRFAFRRPPGISPAGLAHGQDRPRAHDVLRLQHSDRQRLAGLSPARNDYSSVYSIPDSTANRSPSFNFIARHDFSDKLTFSGNAWYRNIRTYAIDANFNTDALGLLIYQPKCTGTGGPRRGGLYRFPGQRRQHHEHTVSEVALHRGSTAVGRPGPDLRWR